MKIKIKSCECDKDFYDEFLYVASRYKKIRKDPTKKAHKLTNYSIFSACLMFVDILLVLFFYFKNKDFFFIFMLGMVTQYFINCLIYLNNVYKRIEVFMLKRRDSTFCINDELLEVYDEFNKHSVKWDDIDSVVVNKYSICFIPKMNTTLLIGFSINYKDSIIKAMKKYQYDSLLVDNSDYYISE